MPCDVVREPCLYPALLSYLFQNCIAATITRNRKQAVIPAIAFMLLNNPLRNFQQPDTGIGIGFLPTGDYP
jgi:hypothetical protein